MKKKPDRKVTAAADELMRIKKDVAKWIRGCKALDLRKAREGKALKERFAVIGRKAALLKGKKKISEREWAAVYDEQMQWSKNFDKWKRNYKALDLQKVREGKALFKKRLDAIKLKVALLRRKGLR